MSGVPCAFRNCRGYFYPASGDTGVVLCAPWGLEETASRAAWRALASAVARAGYPCIRFDYPGTGDSLGSMTGITDAAAWTRAASDAAGFLRAYTGVSRFILIGQSYGAALALDAAADHAAITGLVLITPATSGAAYARHLRSLAGDDDPAGPLDLAGFGLGAAMTASLAHTGPLKRGAGALTGAVVFDRAGRKAGAEVSEHLKRLGVQSTLRVLPPAPATAMAGSPIESTGDIIDALTALHPPREPASPAKLPPLPATLRTAMFREEPLSWADGGGLLCRPAGELQDGLSDRDSVLVLLDAGFSPRVGWRRMAVDLSRALAASGQSSLRLDVQDLAEEAIRDTLAHAAQALKARGLPKIVIAATGAEAAILLRAACGIPIAHVIAIDPAGLVPGFQSGASPSRLDWLGEKLRAKSPPHDGGERIVFYQDLIEAAGQRRPPGLWSRIHRAGAAGLGKVTNRLPDFARIALFRDTGLRDVRHLFATLAARGTKLSLVYSGEPGALRELAHWGGTSAGACRVSLLPGDAQDPAAPEAASWLLDHFIASTREMAVGSAFGGTQTAA